MRVDIDDFVRQRDALIARRAELMEEVARIDAALKPLLTPKPGRARSNRRSGSNSAKVEAFVAQHPGCLLADITKGTDVEAGRVSTACTNLCRTGRLAREQTEHGWAYRINSDVL